MMNGNGNKDLLDITNNNQAASKLNGTNGGANTNNCNTNSNEKQSMTNTTTATKANNQPQLTRSTSTNNNSDDVIVPYSSRALSYRPYSSYGSRSSIVAKKPCNHLTFKEENIQSYTDGNGVLYKVSDYVYMDINKPNQPFAIASILDFKLVIHLVSYKVALTILS
jgi:hypothetical protein